MPGGLVEQSTFRHLARWAFTVVGLLTFPLRQPAAEPQADIQTARRLAVAAQQRARDEQTKAQIASQRAAQEHSPAAGYGSLVYQLGRYYWGEKSADGQREGYGIFYYKDGRCECRFSHDLPVGAGVIVAADGSRYEGEFGGNPSGFTERYGVYNWADGRRFEGQFAGDHPNGPGVLIDALGPACGRTACWPKAARPLWRTASSMPPRDRRAAAATTCRSARGAALIRSRSSSTVRFAFR